MEKNIEFISYTGKYPCLCMGVLTLKIDGELKTFGNPYTSGLDKRPDYPTFWCSGGLVSFDSSDYDYIVTQGRWEWDDFLGQGLPEELINCKIELMNIFNENIEYGCCGGCI